MEPNFDKPHREAFAEAEEKLVQAQAQIEKDTLLAGAHEEAIVEDKDFEYAKEERGRMDDKEMHGALSLEETVALLKEKGYLDTSFEGKEIHELAMRALSKEDALFKFDHSGGRTWIDPDIKDMPYVIPKEQTLDVMIVHFGYSAGIDARAKMDMLGVRSLTFEETVQYGIAYPEHQKKHNLVAFGPTGQDMEKDIKLSCSDTYYRESTRTREKGDTRWLSTTYAKQHGKYYFLVVRK